MNFLLYVRTAIGKLGINPNKKRNSRNKFRFEELGIVGALIIISVVLSLNSPYFLTANNLLRVGRQMAFVGILTTGMSFVIATGQIDISVGRIITLVSFVVATLIAKLGVDPWVAFPLGILAGGICGLINGGLTLIFKVHPMIITLGTLNLYWGLSLGLSNAKPIVVDNESTFFLLGQGEILGVPIPLVIFVITAILGQIILHKTRYGRHVLAVGTNSQAAEYAGIRAKWIRLSVMIFMGLMAGLAGGLSLAFFQTFDPNIGAGMEMTTIAATVIGGADLMGGYASVIGAMFGTFLIGILNNGLVLIGVGAYWNNFITGAVILVAILVSVLFKLKR